MNEIAEEIRDYLETACGSNFNKYYVGFVREELKIPRDYLPVLMVRAPGKSLVTPGLSTARDKYNYSVEIRIIVDVMKYVDQTGLEGNDYVVQHEKALQDFIDEADADGKPLATTILGALRSNITGTAYLFSNEVEIALDDEEKDGRRGATIKLNGITRYNSR